MGWLGSKGNWAVLHRTLWEMAEHDFYVEPFAGTGRVYRAKPPVPSVLVDADPTAPALALEASGLRTICGDALEVLPKLALSAAALVYADPPYLFETRLSRHRYRRDFGDASCHERLLALLQSLPCRVMLAGYPSALYTDRLAGWRRVDIPTVDRGGNRRTECLWMNYQAATRRAVAAHAGHGYRDRLRLTRLRARWRGWFGRLALGDRLAILADFEEMALAEASPEMARGAAEPAGQTDFGFEAERLTSPAAPGYHADAGRQRPVRSLSAVTKRLAVNRHFEAVRR